MKPQILLMALTVVSITAFGQKNNKTIEEKDVPQPVKEALVKKFKGVTADTWEKDSKGYEANFKKDGKKYEVTISESGEWLETEYDVKKGDIPPKAIGYVTTNYKEYKIIDTECEETPEGEFYEVEISNGDEKKELLFNKKGELVKGEK